MRSATTAGRAVVFACLLALATASGAEVVRLNATADIWLSDANEQERNTSAGKHDRIKLKTIQEMAAIRFDASPAAGREIHRATLYLRRASSDMLRYVRVSTVNQDWVEGDALAPYSDADGATYEYADANTQEPWAWPGSQFCDVIMGAGNTFAQWAERRELDDGWVSVQIAADMVYAMLAGDTDGIAIMDGGNPAFANNFLHSAQSPAGSPYIEVELGGTLPTEIAAPSVTAEAWPTAAHLATGAARVTIEPVDGAFCWRVWVDGDRTPRWRVPHPRSGVSTVFVLDDLAPNESHSIRVVAVASSGVASTAADTECVASAALTSVSFERVPPASSPAAATSTAPSVWAAPPLVRVESNDTSSMHRSNAVWDGGAVSLSGARGEYVSFQLVLSAKGAVVERAVVSWAPLTDAAGAEIALSDVELYRVWHARDGDDAWRPAYCIPMARDETTDLRDDRRDPSEQLIQTLYVDIYLPKNAASGVYSGSITVAVNANPPTTVPVHVEVYDFELPDRLSFWPELNAYRIPREGDPHDYYRLAHRHRSVLNCWRWGPEITGSGADVRVRWDAYDRDVGPLLTGEAFRHERRAGAPVEVMYLPFEDSWPTPLTEETYDYHGHWPGRGEDRRHLVDHYMTAPYVADALSMEYISAFLAVQQQFIEHFAEMGYDRTEMQCFYGGKNTHRIDYGSNMWWTTDEPYHWDDWLALQFFCALWTSGRGAANSGLWPARADISRPQWQGRMLDGLVDTVYYGAGAFSSQRDYRRTEILARDTGLNVMTYGSVNRDTEDNSRTVGWVLDAWLHGADGVLPWQTLGNDGALDSGDGSIGGGNALLVPGARFGVPVVADIRLKALRDGQQLVEYMVLLAKKDNLTREQMRGAVRSIVNGGAAYRAGSHADDADASLNASVSASDIDALRRVLAQRIMGP